MVHELDDLLSIYPALIYNCRVGETAAPITYEGDIHIRLTHLLDLCMKKTVNYLSNNSQTYAMYIMHLLNLSQNRPVFVTVLNILFS